MEAVMRNLFIKCPQCKTTHFINFFAKKKFVCPDCHYHFRLTPEEWVKYLCKGNRFQEKDKNLYTIDPLEFPNYQDKLKKAYKQSKAKSAVKAGITEIGEYPVVLAVLDANFMMGSMGAVVGEKITKAAELALDKGLPLIIISASGGARMQEGVISLMQMAKTSAAIKRLDDAGLLFISILTNPTTGGVSASFAFLGDIIIAEPNALIGFAGPRVIQQTIGEELPDGFQRSEFLLEHGMLDLITERAYLKKTLEKLLSMHKSSEVELPPISTDIMKVEEQRHSITDILSLARHARRPTTLDFIKLIFDDFIELHGDRHYGDDKAMVGGIALFQGIPVTVIGHQKGKNTKENIYRHFGMAHPEGYRKALRLMKQAEKFHRPIITFIDTPGAYPGVGAEERGQAEAIARNLHEMSGLKVPIITVITGEGGSGGALGIGVADKILMLENAFYSVISPEGCASILWKDPKKAQDAAQSLKISAFDLLKLGLIDAIVQEPEEGAHEQPEETANALLMAIHAHLTELMQQSPEQIVSQRYQKYRQIKFYGE